jgi:2,3-bisphosphoglycerate-dependent phosphoglycerate mutase
MEIILIRHGESIGNALTGPQAVYTGQWDCDLTERGYQQALALRGDPSFRDVDAFFVSDLKRTIATAKAITDRELIIDPRIRERSLGEFEGRRIDEIRQDPQYEKYFLDPAWMSFRQSFTVSAPGGETYGDVCRRVAPFLADLSTCNFRKVVIVSHFCVIRCLLREIQVLTEEETLNLKIPHCTPIHVLWNE